MISSGELTYCYIISVNNENLTQQEASERANLLTVDTYDVHVDLTYASDTTFDSYPTVTTVKFSAQEGGSTFIDYIHHSVDSVKLNGQHLNVNDVVEGSRIVLKNLAKENILTIHGRSYFSRSGEGMHRFIDPSDQRTYLYTQYEPADARRVFPNFEQPDLKAVFNFRITAPKNWVVSSNAELERTVEDPSDSSITKRVFKSTERISTYITTILAGEYFVATDRYEPQSAINSGAMPLVAYCRQSLKEHFDSDDIFSVTKAGLDFFQDLFDYAYPYPKYEQAFVPEYNLGAMENPGMVTFTESYLFESGATEAQLEARANVICHEMSHMWFGDLVTMKWWNDLWLKESFAEFMGTLGSKQAGKFDEAWVTFANSRKAWAYTQDQMPTTHPIVAEIPHLEAAKQNFDGITYAKGSSALKQLVAYVGFETFIQAARLYFKRFAGGNTTLNDFLTVLDEVSERDVITWASAWLQTEGLSKLYAHRRYDKAGNLLKLEVEQQLPAAVSPSIGRPHQLNIGTFKLQDSKLELTDTIPLEIPAGDHSLVAVPLSESQKLSVTEADVILLNTEDLTYAKVVVSPEIGRATALQYVSTVSDSLSRGLIWGSLWNQVRDAELEVHEFLDAVEISLAQEKSATLLTSITSQAQTAIAHYVPAEQRLPLWNSLLTALKKASASAEPGSDQQLILIRAILSVAAHTPDGKEVAELFAPGAVVGSTAETDGFPGMHLNPTLGWSALKALACLNETTEDILQQAQAHTASALGDRGYAEASASLPQRENKVNAFHRVLTDSELSNDILTATARGFQHGSSTLREGLDLQYFDALLNTWQEKSIGMASRVILGLYPQVNIADGKGDNNPVVRQTKEWLDKHPQAPSALRRLLLELLDDAQRALRGQHFNQG